MHFFLTIFHVMLCFTLILIILLQPGKDGASVFGGGGGGNQMYGPRGQANFLGRATTAVAALFMFTSISLAWYSSHEVQAGSNIDDDILRLEAEMNAAGPTGAIVPEPLPEIPTNDPPEDTDGGAEPATGEELTTVTLGSEEPVTEGGAE
jgi:preprotein translocase subunit SecG